MTENEPTVFRKKALERMSSPEQLTDYLCVTNPGIWVLLAAVILLLGALFAWSAIGTLETSASVRVIVEEHVAQVVSKGGEGLAEGMPLRVAAQESVIAATSVDEFGRVFGVAEVALPGGVYDGTVVVERTKPIDFLLKADE